MIDRKISLRVTGGLVVLLLAACTRAPEIIEPPAEIPVPPPVVKPAPPPQPSAQELAAQRRAALACKRVTIAGVGDIMLGNDFPDDRLAEDDGEQMLAEVTPILVAADIAFGNLEGVLMDGGEPIKTCKDPSACYLFRTPARYAQRLADAGFDVMSLANNHARDFGEPGRTASMAALDSADIKHSGRVGDIATWPNGEVKVALIAFAPFTNSYPMLDLDTARSEVEFLSRNYDLVIVSFHGGAEGLDAARVPFGSETYYGENRGDVVEFSRAMIDSGADLVLGHGPHVVRAIETYKDRLIAYSLGNFATYYGISVTGQKGLAPILLATLDGNGRFVNGEIVSTVQVRPIGPKLDDQNRAFERIWELTEQDFGGGDLRFQLGGVFFPQQEIMDGCATPAATPGS